jgi:hypothetical protein
MWLSAAVSRAGRMPIADPSRVNRWATPRVLIRTRFEAFAAILIGRAVYSRKRTPLVFLEGSYSYNFDYTGGFLGSRNVCKLLKINGRGERI